MAKVKAKKATRVIHIYTPEEKREWAMMRAVDRCEESLARIFRGEEDPETAMLLQSAVQQELLEESNRREGVLWAMYASVCERFMSKSQRERYDKLMKSMIDRREDKWIPSCGKVWLENGKKLKERVLGTSTARPVRINKNQVAK